MYSFYGGKQGRTYHIVKTYASIADMTAAFSTGGQYTDVMYHEYVLIDTTLPRTDGALGINDRENGCLYRRGFDYNQAIATRPEYQYDGIVLTNQSEWDEYIHAPGAGAIYVGTIRGADGPGVLVDKVNVSTKSANSTKDQTDPDWETDVEEHNKVDISLTSTAVAGKPTTYTLNSTVPLPTFLQPTVNVVTASSATKVTISPYSDNAPLLLHSTFDIPRGPKGDSVTNVTVNANNSTQQYLNFQITTYDGNGSTGTLTSTAPYRGISNISKQTNGTDVIATYTYPVDGNSTVNLGSLTYGLLTQQVVYRIPFGQQDVIYTGDLNSSISKIPAPAQGELPYVIVQTLNQPTDSRDSSNVVGTYIMGYDSTTGHQVQFTDVNSTLTTGAGNKWYIFQNMSETINPSKVVTSGIRNKYAEAYGTNTTYSDVILANVNNLAPGGYILQAFDTVIHEFGTPASVTQPGNSGDQIRTGLYNDKKVYTTIYDMSNGEPIATNTETNNG